MKNFNIKVQLCKNINFKVIAENELTAIRMVNDIIENSNIFSNKNNKSLKYKLKKEELKSNKKENLSIPFVQVNVV